MAPILKRGSRSRPKDINQTIAALQQRELSKQEREVVRLVAEGYRNKEVSKKLNISVKTVASYRANIMKKLALRNIVHLVHYAIKKGIIAIEVD
jgi:DNA-binding CsgD family transcriptional regulator